MFSMIFIHSFIPVVFYRSITHWMTPFATKPNMPNAKPKKIMKVPNLPAFDSQANCKTMNSMYSMKADTPMVRPNQANCSSVKFHITQTLLRGCAQELPQC